MKFQTLIAIVLCLVFIGAWTPAHAQDKVFNATQFTLDNGLEVVVIPNHRAPVVTHMVWYRVGAADETPGHSGIAHFLEHLMFKGSLGFGPGEFSRTIKALGGNDNAFTSQDYTAYFQSVASKHLELVMRMEAGRMRGMNPPLEEVLSERDVVREERRQRTDNNPQGRFSEAVNAALFVNHPYGTPVIGWGHEIEKMEWPTIKEFYDTHYGPNNAILVVSGDVEPDEVHTLAKDIYGPIPKIEAPKRDWTVMPALSASPIIEMRDPNVKQPSIGISFLGPNARENKQDTLALDILAEIMGGGSTSRIYKSLVKNKKIASSAGLAFDGNNWGPGRVQLYASPLPGQDLDTVKDALLEELEILLADGITTEELNDAKTRMIDQAIYARDSLSGPAMIVGQALASGSTLDDVEYWPRNINKITKRDIERAAAQYLDINTNRVVYGYLLPEKSPEPAPAPEQEQTQDQTQAAGEEGDES